MSKETKEIKKHRKMWVDAYGHIPKDSKGRSYEIHHINGNHHDNRLANFKLVTIDEHYSIHYAQGDFGACKMIALRMRLSPDEQSALQSALAVEMWKSPEYRSKQAAIRSTDSFRESCAKGGRMSNGGNVAATNGTLNRAHAQSMRLMMSVEDGKITNAMHRTRHEKRTGHSHTWIEL